MKQIRMWLIFSISLLFSSAELLFAQTCVIKTEGPAVRFVLQFRDGLIEGLPAGIKIDGQYPIYETEEIDLIPERIWLGQDKSGAPWHDYYIGSDVKNLKLIVKQGRAPFLRVVEQIDNYPLQISYLLSIPGDMSLAAVKGYAVNPMSTPQKKDITEAELAGAVPMLPEKPFEIMHKEEVAKIDVSKGITQRISLGYDLDSLADFIETFTDKISATMNAFERVVTQKIQEDDSINQLIINQRDRNAIVNQIMSNKGSMLSKDQENALIKYGSEEVAAINILNKKFDEFIVLPEVATLLKPLMDAITAKIIETPYASDVQLTKRVVQDYITIKAQVHLLKDLGFRASLFTWCQGCPEAPLSKRIAIVVYLIKKVQMQFPDKSLPLVIASLGSGRLLQEFLFLKQLKGLGYENLTVNIIDFAYGDKESWLIEKPGLLNTIYALRDFLGLKLGGSFMEHNFLPPALSQLNVFQDIKSYYNRCIQQPDLKSHIFMAIDIGYFPYFSAWPYYALEDTNGLIFFKDDKPILIAFLPKYTRPHLYLGNQMFAHLYHDIRQFINEDKYRDRREQMKLFDALASSELPAYVSDVAQGVSKILVGHIGTTQVMYFIDSTLIIEELILKTMQPSYIAVLINCDFFELLSPTNFMLYDYKSLFERDCRDHLWVPKSYSIVPDKKKNQDWILFHGNFKEIQ